jgi:NADH dehydrogenase FAD-containing subunit
LVVDGTLAVPGSRGLSAIGDCAAITDAKAGQPYPPTAQFALSQAQVLADNIVVALYKSQYAVERLTVAAMDGTRIPVTVVYRKDKNPIPKLRRYPRLRPGLFSAVVRDWLVPLIPAQD